MISQNVEVIGYISPMQRSATAYKTTVREKSSSHFLFRDVMCAVLMILFPIFLMVFLNAINVQEEYSMQRIRREVMVMAKENAVMKLEVSRLEAPVRVQQIAETKLGMSLPLHAIYGGQDPIVPDQNKGR